MGWLSSYCQETVLFVIHKTAVSILGNDCINSAPNGAGAKSFHKTAKQKQNKPIHREWLRLRLWLWHQAPFSLHILDEFDAANESKFEVTPHKYKQWGELDHILQSVLPPNYTYLVEHHQELPKASISGAPKVCFQAHFRVNLQNEEQVKHWLHALHKCTYCVTRTYKPLLIRVKYKVDMHCQHFQKKLTD